MSLVWPSQGSNPQLIALRQARLPFHHRSGLKKIVLTFNIKSSVEVNPPSSVALIVMVCWSCCSKSNSPTVTNVSSPSILNSEEASTINVTYKIETYHVCKTHKRFRRSPMNYCPWNEPSYISFCVQINMFYVHVKFHLNPLNCSGWDVFTRNVDRGIDWHNIFPTCKIRKHKM